MIGPIGAAASGISVANAWLDAAADDIANADDGTTAAGGPVHRAQTVRTAPDAAGGVAVTGVSYGGEVDLVQQMAEMIVAERSVQANAVTIERSVDSFNALLSAGDQHGLDRRA